MKHLTENNQTEVIFFTGLQSAVLPVYLRTEVMDENDMIIEDFYENYTNLTLKTVLMLKWVNRNCNMSNLKIFAKIDDDVFVNPVNFLKVLDSRKDMKNLMLGNLACERKVTRSPGDKYHVPYEVYSYSYYTDFLSGTGYVISADLLPDLYMLALRSNFFHLEDVFLTGFLRKQLNVVATGHEGFVLCIDVRDEERLKTVVLVHCFEEGELEFAWGVIRGQTSGLAKNDGWTCRL